MSTAGPHGLRRNRDAFRIGQVDADVLHLGVGLAGGLALARRRDDAGCAGLEERRHQRLSDAAIGAGNENDLPLHLAVRIVDDGRFHGGLLRHGDEDLLAAAIEAVEEPHALVDPCAGRGDACHDDRPCIELHRARDQRVGAW